MRFNTNILTNSGEGKILFCPSAIPRRIDVATQLGDEQESLGNVFFCSLKNCVYVADFLNFPCRNPQLNSQDLIGVIGSQVPLHNQIFFFCERITSHTLLQET